MQVFKASAVASLAVFAWGFVFWLTPYPYRAVDRLGGEAAEREERQAELVSYLKALQEKFPETGLFLVPSPEDPLEMLKELRERGPSLTIHVVAREDAKPWWMTLLIGFLRLFFTVFLAGWLLNRALPALSPTYGTRVLFVTVVGCVVVLYRDLSDAIWWYYPWAWSLVKASYDMIAWMLAGLILAGFIKRT